MTVGDHLRIVRQRWLAIVLAVVIGVIGAGAVHLLQPPQYTATLQMYVSSPSPAADESALSAAQLAQTRVTSYAELATSPRIIGDVTAELGLDLTPEDLAAQIVASATDESVVLVIQVTDSSAERAAAIANSAGGALQRTVADLERPEGPGPAAVAIRPVEAAPVPNEESSLGLAKLLAVGAMLGLAAGLALVLARDALDTSVTSTDQLVELLKAPSLGSVVRDGRLARRPLAIRDDPTGAVAEDLKRLRTNLQFVDVDNPHRVLMVTSARPGEGKTTTTVNLGLALSAGGHRVLLVEADLRRPHASTLLDLDGSIGLTSVLTRRLSAIEAVQSFHRGRFDVLSSGPLPPNPSELLGSAQTRDVIAELRGRYDLVLIDTSPLLPVTDAAALAPHTDGALLVCRARSTTRAEVVDAAEALRAVGAPVRGTVLTMAEPSGARVSAYGSPYPTLGSAASAPRAHRAKADTGGTRTDTINPGAGERPQPSPRPRSRGTRTAENAGASRGRN